MFLEKSSLEEFCKRENCPHYNHIERLRTNTRVGITEKSASDKRIKETQEDYCSQCNATKLYNYLIEKRLIINLS